ncbi:MAG TPA: cupin domain-containing protein [Sphingomicrobium sp.]|nr:cupin domain-containing protein [Sphingomicrobium sp.]
MISSRLIVLPILLAAAAAPVAPALGQGPVNKADLKWGPGPAGLPKGAELVVLSGNPEQEGMFTIRLKFPANYTVPPHFHPAPELVTVIDGQLSLGMGDAIDKAKAANLGVGGYAVAPATMHHYAFTGSEGATVQVTSHGPFKITYVNAGDDPRGAK